MGSLNFYQPFLSDGFFDFPKIEKNFSEFSENNKVGFDVIDNKDHVVLFVDIPGVSKEDLDIEVEDKKLVVSGFRKSPLLKDSESEEESNSRYGKFSRTFRLSDKIDSEKIAANIENGVLRIALPKQEDKKMTKIKIGGESPFLKS